MKPQIKVNSYAVMVDCIERGIDAGWAKAHKHNNKPSENIIKEQISHYIELEISEYFYFDNE